MVGNRYKPRHHRVHGEKVDATEILHLGEVATKVKEVVNEDILRHLLHSSVRNLLTATSGSEIK